MDEGEEYTLSASAWTMYTGTIPGAYDGDASFSITFECVEGVLQGLLDEVI